MRALALMLLLLLPACSITMDLPPDFLRIGRSGHEYKAITPDDGRLWVREFANDDDGTLEFWATTLQNDLVQKRGYELVGTTTTRDGAGHDGTQFECRAVANGERYGYLVSVFAVPRSFPLFSAPTIMVVEFTAREAVFTARLDAVRDAIASLRP